MANVFLGREQRKWGFLQRNAMLEEYNGLQHQLDVDIDPDQPAGRLSIADQQSLEILRGLAADAKILILDEPTASIGLHEREALYSIVRKLRSRGVAILLISHDLDEVLELSDHDNSAARRSKGGARASASEWTKQSLVDAMLGDRRGSAISIAAQTHRPCNRRSCSRPATYIVPGKVQGVSFSVGRGEIVGIAGPGGLGRTELLRAIVGMEPGSSGKLRIKGKEHRLADEARAPRASLASLLLPRTENSKVWFSVFRRTPMLRCLIRGKRRTPDFSRRVAKWRGRVRSTERLGLAERSSQTRGTDPVGGKPAEAGAGEMAGDENGRFAGR